ncbi:ketopantoate reductase family protein [Curtobacterium sp. MCBD17_032]|uniref:ketopantoate reductase family protein n=1 Tax=Curtobacterium sp. MCBD17_032 TaxID=2175659 RepID=UPI0015E8A498|nr:2-dehydropantoate 2-reductase [Curtobacterium sp. MCBD17_032]
MTPTDKRKQHSDADQWKSERATVAVVGAGAIGSTLADSLSHNARVILCRRSAPRPMRLCFSGLERVIGAEVWAEPEQAEPVDWVVIATKAQDTGLVGDWLRRLVGPHTNVVVAQNGIDHEARLPAWIPRSQILPAVVYTAAERTGLDQVTVHNYGSLALPETPVALQFAELVRSLVSVHFEADFQAASWCKLIMNAAISSVTTLTSRSVSVTANSAVAELVDGLLEEGIRVAAAAGVRISSTERGGMLTQIRQLPRAHRTSLEVDATLGRPTEYEFLSGALLRYAVANRIAVPRLASVHALLSALLQPARTQL